MRGSALTQHTTPVTNAPQKLHLMPRNPLSTGVAKFRFRCEQSQAVLPQMCHFWHNAIAFVVVLTNCPEHLMWCSINLWQWMVLRVCVYFELGLELACWRSQYNCLREQQHHYSAVLYSGFERPCSHPGISLSLSRLSLQCKGFPLCASLSILPSNADAFPLQGSGIGC